jgi:diguanylate cyclase (GGDEF)-like protein
MATPVALRTIERHGLRGRAHQPGASCRRHDAGPQSVQAVNDTLGHPAGDVLLKTVADRLSIAVRSDDTVARLGGDEFAVLVHTFDPTSEATSIAKRIHEVLSAPFDLGEHRVEIGTSIGIAITSADASHPDELIKRADVALYRAKQGGGDCFRFFELAMEQRRPAEDAQPQPRASAA